MSASRAVPAPGVARARRRRGSSSSLRPPCGGAVDRHRRRDLGDHAALGLINTIILPPPHKFVAEIQDQSQFLMPQPGVSAIPLHFAGAMGASMSDGRNVSVRKIGDKGQAAVIRAASEPSTSPTRTLPRLAPMAVNTAEVKRDRRHARLRHEDWD